MTIIKKYSTIYQLPFIRYHLSNTLYQIPIMKYHLSTTIYQIPLIKYHLSNTIYQILFIKYHISNTICCRIFFNESINESINESMNQSSVSRTAYLPLKIWEINITIWCWIFKKSFSDEVIRFQLKFSKIQKATLIVGVTTLIFGVYHQNEGYHPPPLWLQPTNTMTYHHSHPSFY